MIHRLRSVLLAGWVALASSPLAFAGDYDQVLATLARAFPEAKNVGVFYDQMGTLLNQMEFEGSSFKELGINIRLLPLDGTQRLTSDSVRRLCNQHRLQAVILMEGDSLIKPGSVAGRAVVGGASHLPTAGIQYSWLADGAWFVVGPGTKGVQIGPRVKDAKVKEALRLAGEALPKE
jgi:hypothetical protein